MLFDDFHRVAEQCHRLALASKDRHFRSRWLKLAADFLAMIPPDYVPSEQKFNVAVQAKQTG